MKFDPSTLESKRLQLAGLPGYLLQERQFKLKEYIGNYTSSTDGLKPMPVKAKEQLDHYAKIIDDPTHASYVAAFCSDPNDLKAKALGAAVMLEALRRDLSVHWHTVVGGFRDPMRDKPSMFRKHDLIILSNLPYDSTDVKWEKARDILEIFSDTPRIVITTGCEPITLFNEIGYHLNYSLWLRGSRTMRALGSEAHR